MPCTVSGMGEPRCGGGISQGLSIFRAGVFSHDVAAPFRLMATSMQDDPNVRFFSFQFSYPGTALSVRF